MWVNGTTITLMRPHHAVSLRPSSSTFSLARSEVYGVYAGKGKPVHIFCADNDADVAFALSLSPALITANDPPALMKALGRM